MHTYEDIRKKQENHR